MSDGHKKAAMTCERWGGLDAYHERHSKLHDSDVLPGLVAEENADAVSGQLGRRYRRGLSEWHPDFVLIGSDCIGSFCDLQPHHVLCTGAPFSLDIACCSGVFVGSKPRTICRWVMQTAPILFAWLLAGSWSLGDSHERHMAKINLTKTVADAAQAWTCAVELRDTVAPGFMCKVTSTGRKVFMLQYRANSGAAVIQGMTRPRPARRRQ